MLLRKRQFEILTNLMDNTVAQNVPMKEVVLKKVMALRECIVLNMMKYFWEMHLFILLTVVLQ